VPQFIPAGLLTIVPLAEPLDVTSLTTRVFNAKPEELKVAVQPMLLVIVTLPAAVQLPDQPPNVEPEAGVAVNVTSVRLLRVVEQVLPQLIPAGLLATVPVPFPIRFTVSVYVVVRLNTAVQLIVELTVTLLPQAVLPDQPAKV
jgi:hypothetical protein